MTQIENKPRAVYYQIADNPYEYGSRENPPGVELPEGFDDDVRVLISIKDFKDKPFYFTVVHECDHLSQVFEVTLVD